VTAAERARWLAELSQALDDAQTLLWRLDPERLRDVDALDLSARLEAARAHIRSIRLQPIDQVADKPRLEWTCPHPWTERVEDCA
jgi:hypothetical protein